MARGSTGPDTRQRFGAHPALPVGEYAGRLPGDRDLSFRSWGIEEPAIRRWQRVMLLAVRPALAFAVRRMLADGRRYLTGETLTFADITFASLGALACRGRGTAGAAVRPVHPAAVPGRTDPPAGLTFAVHSSGSFSSALQRLRCSSSAAARTPACRFESSSDAGSHTRADDAEIHGGIEQTRVPMGPVRKEFLDSLTQRHGPKSKPARR